MNHRFLRSAGAALAALICLFSAWTSARMGYSRLLAEYGIFTGLVGPVNRSVELSPDDPEAHYARALVFKGTGNIQRAVEELASAIDLRPGDYLLWLEMGRLRDQLDDQSGALEDFKKSVRLAPFYAQPRWQLGNLLLRMGRPEEAFPELRLAATSDPTLLRPLIDIAWMTYRGDAESVRRVTHPATQSEELALAHFFAGHGAANEALKLFRSAKAKSPAQRRELLSIFLQAGEYSAAYEVWAGGRAEGATPDQSGFGIVANGGFESDVDWSDPGFGWQKEPGDSTIRITADKTQSMEGQRSLLLNWAGDSDPSRPVLTHLLVIEPESRYRLRFSVRTESLVSGSLPVIVVLEAGINGGELAQSQPFGRGTNGWQEYSVDFVTKKDSRAVLIALRRQDCRGEPCPIFGRTWFDLFRLEKLGEGR